MCCKLMDVDVEGGEERRREEERGGLSICCGLPCIAARQRALAGNW